MTHGQIDRECSGSLFENECDLNNFSVFNAPKRGEKDLTNKPQKLALACAEVLLLAVGFLEGDSESQRAEGTQTVTPVTLSDK